MTSHHVDPSDRRIVGHGIFPAENGDHGRAEMKLETTPTANSIPFRPDGKGLFGRPVLRVGDGGAGAVEGVAV